MPALGPSFGVAPSGTCTCKSYLRYTSLGSILLVASSFSGVWLGIIERGTEIFPVSINTLTTLSAILADSFMTSPREPVS